MNIKKTADIQGFCILIFLRSIFGENITEPWSEKQAKKELQEVSKENYPTFQM